MSQQVVTAVYDNYYVRTRSSGGAYLTVRANREAVNEHKYRWVKEKTKATRMSYDVAQKCRQRYGGTLIRCTNVTLEEELG